MKDQNYDQVLKKFYKDPCCYPDPRDMLQKRANNMWKNVQFVNNDDKMNPLRASMTQQ